MTAECRLHHLLNIEYRQNFQVQAENTHPIDRSFAKHIDVPG